MVGALGHDVLDTPPGVAVQLQVDQRAGTAIVGQGVPRSATGDEDAPLAVVVVLVAKERPASGLDAPPRGLAADTEDIFIDGAEDDAPVCPVHEVVPALAMGSGAEDASTA